MKAPDKIFISSTPNPSDGYVGIARAYAHGEMDEYSRNKTMELEEGIYEIPDDCTAVYSKRKVIVKKMLDADKPKVMHCADCIHQKWGRHTMRNQWYDSPYCEKKPKIIDGKGGYFYNANSFKKACEMFEPKES